MEKTKIRIDAAMLDMTRTVPESMQKWESISINTALVLVTEKTRPLLSMPNISVMSAATVLEVPEGAKLKQVNGSCTIGAADVPNDKTVMIINGDLILEKGEEQAIMSYPYVQVNGRVLCPRSLCGALTGVTVNGDIVCYPDDATLVRGDLCLNGRFLRRLRENERFYVTGDVYATESDMDADALLAKNPSFICKNAWLLEKYERCDICFDDQTRMHVIPDGYAFLEKEKTIDDTLVPRYGTKLFFLNNVSVPREAAHALDEIESVIAPVANVHKAVQDTWLRKCAHCDEIRLYEGIALSDMPRLRVTKDMLEGDDKIRIEGCPIVEFAEDVPAELIRERVLSICDCACVRCDESQLGAVQIHCEDCNVTTQAEEKNEEPPKAADDVTRINAATYIL